MKSFDNSQQFYREAERSLASTNEFITAHKLQESVIVDHVCYKVASSDRYSEIRKLLETDYEWSHQATISMRNISTIRTKGQIHTVAGTVSLIELSDQKPDGSQEEGFHHVELQPTNIDYDTLVKKLTSEGVEVKEVFRPHHTTHDIKLTDGFIVRLTRQSLCDNIKGELN